MTENRSDGVMITDVTLREFGQNVKKERLNIFTPEIRSEMAQSLIDAGIKNIEVFSCVHPSIAPSMNANEVTKTAQLLGRIEGANLITLVPNNAGLENFLKLNLGPDGYNHTVGLFFSAVESHNLANLGRSINETIDEYKIVSSQASTKNIRMIGYLSAAFGYLEPETHRMIKPNMNDVLSYINILFDLGAEIVTLSDLQGVADENETKRILESIINKRQNKDTHRLGYHPHHISDNHALTNSQVAYKAGIRQFDASLGGTGGCVTGAPGNQPTEKLVQMFEESGIDTGIDRTKVTELAQCIRGQLYNKMQYSD